MRKELLALRSTDAAEANEMTFEQSESEKLNWVN